MHLVGPNNSAISQNIMFSVSDGFAYRSNI